MARFEEEILIKINVAKEQAKKAFDEIKENAKKFASGVAKAAKFAAVALAGLGTAMLGIVASTAATGDEIAKMSKRINVSVEDLSALRFQAQLAGTDFNTVSNGLRFLTKAAFDTTQGLLTAKRGFDILGISATDEAGKLKDVTLLFNEAAGALSEMEDGTEKVAAVQLLFGSRMGTQLLPLLNQGSDALKAQAEEARKLGIVYSAELAAASEEFVDNQLRVKSALDGLKILIGSELMPVVNQFLIQIKDWILLNKTELTDSIITVLNKTKEIIVTIWDTIAATGQWIKENKELLATLAEFATALIITSKIIAFTTAIQAMLPAIVAVKAAIAGGAGLTALFASLGPALTLAGGALALFLGYKVGEIILGWTTEMGRLKKTIKENQEETTRLGKEFKKRLVAKGISDIVGNMDEFKKAVKEGKIVFDKTLGSWIESTNVAKESTVAIVEQTEAIKEAQIDLSKYADEVDRLGESYLKVAETRFKEELEQEKVTVQGLADATSRYKAVIQNTFDTRLNLHRQIISNLDQQGAEEEKLNNARVALAESEIAETEHLLSVYRDYYGSLGKLRDEAIKEQKEKIKALANFEEDTLQIRKEIDRLISDEEIKSFGDSRTEQEKYYDAVTALDQQYQAATSQTGQERLDSLKEYIEAVSQAASDISGIRTGMAPDVDGIITLNKEATATALERMKAAREEWSVTSEAIKGTLQDSIASSQKAANAIGVAMDQAAKEVAFFTDEILAMQAELEELKVKFLISVDDQASPVIQAIKNELDTLRDKTVTITTIHRDVFAGGATGGELAGPVLHDGLDVVPQDMWAFLQKGEQVVTAAQNPNNPAATSQDQRQDNRSFTFHINGGNQEEIVNSVQGALDMQGEFS